MNYDKVIKIGDQITDQTPQAYELVVTDHVPILNPREHSLEELIPNMLDPRTYFITSGDAVEKTKVLAKDLWVLALKVRALLVSQVRSEFNCDYNAAQKRIKSKKMKLKQHQHLPEFDRIVWEATSKCRHLLGLLLVARGVNRFLETEWSNHQLLCIPKNPRKKSP